jgi:hypothetical protein
MSVITRRLGKLPAVYNPSIPTIHKLLINYKSLPQILSSTNWRAAVTSWPMLDNDDCGNCVVAGMLHAVQGWSANANVQIVPDTTAAISDYMLMTGALNGTAYNPKTGANDSGLVIDQALGYWMNTGISITHSSDINKISGQATVDTHDTISIKRVIAEFGGLFAGLQLPTTAETEINNGQPWTDLSGVVGSWGGHGVWVIDFDANWLYIVTWGAIQKCSWAWFQKYADEAKALINLDWISSKSNLSPSQFTISSLDTDVQNMHGIMSNTQQSSMKDQIKHMVGQFLGYKLPKDFNPDGGISYTRPNYHPDVDATLYGTNLLDATQTEALVHHMIDGLPTPLVK